MKNIVVASIVAVALIICALVLKSGMENSRRLTPPESFSLYGYEGVVYRLNSATGRIDVLVPSKDAALLFPVGQVQLPGPNEKLTDEQKAGFSSNLRALSQYIQAQHVRSLSLNPEPAKAATEIQ